MAEYKPPTPTHTEAFTCYLMGYRTDKGEFTKIMLTSDQYPTTVNLGPGDRWVMMAAENGKTYQEANNRMMKRWKKMIENL